MSFVSFFSENEERISGEGRPFVDREEFIQAFKNALENIKEKERSVLIYYGVAGIGKTSLRKELPKVITEYNRLHKESSILWTAVNFETEEFRHPQKFLEILRDQFQDEYDIKFHMFDIAHAFYWKKVNPRVPLYRENYSKNSIVAHLLDIGDELSGISDVFNPTKLLLNIRGLIKKLPEKYVEWALENMDEISQLIYMDPSEIEKRLYLYWAYDLHKYLLKTSESAVIFIDSYETLWGKDRSQAKLSSADQWIRKLIQKLLSSSCLWVLCGQEPPQWEKYSEVEEILWENLIEMHKIGGIPEEDARYLLEYYGVFEKDIQDTIISGSEGVPYYLELSIDTYKSIKKIKKPELNDFANVPADIFGRFIKYLDENKEEAIKVLSVPNFWNRDIFNALIKKFTSYPQSGLSTLHNFSFIDKDETEDNKWTMHKLMRKSWQEYQERNEPDERKNVHEFMFNYYVNKLENLDIKKITQEQKTALIEAFYHAKESMESEYLLDWFIDASDPFERAAFWHLISHIYEEMLQMLETRLGPKHLAVATTLNNLAELYFNIGNYDKALPLFQRAFDIHEKILGPKCPIFGSTLNRFGLLYHYMGDYDKALPLYQRALDIYENMLGPQHPVVATTLNNIAGVYVKIGDYKKAFPLYYRAFSIQEKKLDPQRSPDSAITLNNIGLLLHYMEDYDGALMFYQAALKIHEKNLVPKYPEIVMTLNNLALIYESMGDCEKGLPFYQKALEIHENMPSPPDQHFAKTLNNLAGLYEIIGDYNKALPLYQKALEIYENILGRQHLCTKETLKNVVGIYSQIKKIENH